MPNAALRFKPELTEKQQEEIRAKGEARRQQREAERAAHRVVKRQVKAAVEVAERQANRVAREMVRADSDALHNRSGFCLPTVKRSSRGSFAPA